MNSRSSFFFILLAISVLGATAKTKQVIPGFCLGMPAEAGGVWVGDEKESLSSIARVPYLPPRTALTF